MTLYAQRLTGTFAAALVAAAILVPGGLAETGQSPTQSLLAKYGWGAAAAYAKIPKRSVGTAIALPVTHDLVAKYGWGAAAAYAKLHKQSPLAKSVAVTPPTRFAKSLLARYGWGAAAAFAKAKRAAQSTRDSR
jgi:hypothetical protein